MRAALPACDGWSARWVSERHERVEIDSGITKAPWVMEDEGVMLTVQVGSGRGYAATADTSPSGLREAATRAKGWAEHARDAGIFDMSATPFTAAVGSWSGPVARPMSDVPFAERLALLSAASAPIVGFAPVVQWTANLWSRHLRTRLVTSAGGDLQQETSMVVPLLMAFAKDGRDTLARSTGRHNGA
ncbi:MAG: hypothetical protein KC656_18695, partial [Myxococcales bacterium]|nr:hypothetical protein [Myxococcales bacterium]